MIARIWHGWTTNENADLYESLLKNEIFPGIGQKKIEGYRKISLLKCSKGDEVEFITIMLFDDLNAVKVFAGNNFEESYVPQKARQILLRFDALSKHYEIINELEHIV
jgi:hypothetical protein